MSTQKSPVDLWTSALRSGEYEQGKNSLRPERGKYCCLGVACEVYLKHADPSINERAIVLGALAESSYLPLPVKHWLGLRVDDGKIGDGSQYRSLIDFNDEKEWSFEAIADLIECRPQGLFVNQQEETN